MLKELKIKFVKTMFKILQKDGTKFATDVLSDGSYRLSGIIEINVK